MSSGKRNLKSEFFRFMAILIVGAVIVTILGLFFIHSLFKNTTPPASVDFSGAIQERLAVANPPASENKARVFFTSNGRHLSGEYMELPPEMNQYQRVDALLRRLFTGPSSKYFEPVIPEGAAIRGIYLTGNEMNLDLSEGIRENFQGGISTEMLVVYSIVNTVVMNVEGIDRVQILIEGRVVETLAGEVDISSPLGANINLVRW